jgi:uncharacterized protein (DUF2267 family)
MSTGLAVFDTTVNETNEWLKAVETELRCDRHQAFVALRSVMHVLRDRLAPGGAMRLAAQLPILLRGVFVEGWRPDETPVRTHSAEAFVRLVAESLPDAFPIGPDTVTRAVLQALWRRMNGGAMAKVKQELPSDIARLWPDESLIP